MRGAIFNLKFGRRPAVVVDEVTDLIDYNGLSFVCTQEQGDYVDALRDAGCLVVGSGESGIVVHPSVAVDRVRRHQYGDGWTTVRGGRFPPAVQWAARLDGWLTVRSVHLPTPSSWQSGHPEAPRERLDDLVATSLGLRRFLRKHGARLAAGDWNEPPETVGRYSPRWIAEQSGSRIVAPKVGTGHGRIDYVMANGCLVSGLRVARKLSERSDHEPVVFTVIEE